MDIGAKQGAEGDSRTVQEAVDEYRYAILQLSEKTQTWYMARLERFGSWCGQERLVLRQVRPTSIAKYLHTLATTDSQRTEKPLSTYTLHGHARTIRTFLFWCASEPQSYLTRAIPENIVMPHIKEKIIETFTPLQIKALFAAADQEMTPALRARTKAILALLLDTGIRASELCGLLIEDVHITPREGHVRVTGKGDKEREVGLGVKCRQYLQSWLKSYRKAPADELHVFLSHKKTPLTLNGLDELLYRLRDRAKITGVRVSAHTFRHTFACNFLLQGGDLYVLSRLMGHTTTLVTQRYLKAMKADQARKTGLSVLDRIK
jgi:site-specific recombinase XerD